MDILEAHSRLAMIQDRAGVIPDDEATAMAPVIDAAFASLSGMLENAADDDDLQEAIDHGSSLLSCGIIDGYQMQDECRDLMNQLADLAVRMGGKPCSTG